MKTYLQHVAENAQNTVEALVVLRASSICVSLPRNPSHHFCNKDKVDDQGRCKQRVLAHIEQADSLMSTHEDLRIVFVQSTLVVSNGWHILDDDGMVWVFARLVEHRVGGNHIVHDVGLRDLLGAELFLGAEVFPVIISKVIVAGNGRQFDASVDKEVDESRFHLSLARLEVVAADEGTMLFGKLNCTWDEGVLRRTIDEGNIL